MGRIERKKKRFVRYTALILLPFFAVYSALGWWVVLQVGGSFLSRSVLVAIVVCATIITIKLAIEVIYGTILRWKK